MSWRRCPTCHGAGMVEDSPPLSYEQACTVLTQAAVDHWAVSTEIIGEIREPNLVAARRQIARRLRAGGWSASRIGRFLHRDHSTILYYLQTTCINGHLTFDKPTRTM